MYEVGAQSSMGQLGTAAHRSVILSLGGPKQGDYEFEASLGYTALR